MNYRFNKQKTKSAAELPNYDPVICDHELLTNNKFSGYHCKERCD